MKACAHSARGSPCRSVFAAGLKARHAALAERLASQQANSNPNPLAAANRSTRIKELNEQIAAQLQRIAKAQKRLERAKADAEAKARATP